jgi:NTP pyrophosphatase (non-canonical NTP hydrolase)
MEQNKNGIYKVISLLPKDAWYKHGAEQFEGKYIFANKAVQRPTGDWYVTGIINNERHTFAHALLEPVDTLAHIFEMQKRLQDKIGVDPTMLSGDRRTEFIRLMFIGLVTEAAEVIERTPWKPWKKSAQYDEEGLKEELVDVAHFFINLCLAANLSPEELLSRYAKKHETNMQRQENGY